MIKNHTLYYEQDSRIPVTYLSFVFLGGGEQQETEEKAGLGRLTAKLLFRGTQTLSREEIQKQFDLLGAEVYATITETEFTIHIQALSKTLDSVIDLVAECISHPLFSEEELTVSKQQQRAGLSAALQDSENVLRAAHRYILFNTMRFGKIGSLSALEKISREDVVEYFSKIKNCETAYATSISDIAYAEIEKRIQKIFSLRAKNGFTLLPEAEYAVEKKTRAHIFHVENASNDRLLWSHKGLSAADSQRFGLSLIIDALGSFEGYLFDHLRNKNGWCYGAYASIITGTGRIGRITYYSDPSNETSQYLIPALLEHLKKFSTQQDFIERLSERPSSFKNRFVYQLDKKYAISSRVQFDRYGVPILTKEQYYKEIDAASESVACDIIKNIFLTSNLTMVFYGDATRISKILSSSGITDFIYTYNPSELIQ